jgi:hypothetical protein
MSIRITIACEDHTLDQYVAKPILKALLSHLGKPNADVRMVTNPRIGGISQLKSNVCNILELYGAISALVIFIVDGDCAAGRSHSFRQLASTCEHGDKAIVVVAREEVEVWALWGSRPKLGAPWADVLAECHPKERFYESLVTSADRKMPGRGRQRLVALSLEPGWVSLRSGCSELNELEDAVRAKLGL